MLETTGLTKHYGALVAVDDIGFTVQAGEVLGFLGPNGAGKTTTMRMIAGFVRPSAGTARVCGFDVQEHPIEARRSLGYLPEGAPHYAEMTPRSFLDFIADVRELEGVRRRSRLDDVIERLHLQPVLEQRIETLSKGFKRRVGLAQAIVHDPAVLVLDEPTDGLDPNQKHEVRELIRTMSAEKIIVISTHILEEVDAVCSRAIVIADGRILADDTPKKLGARSRYHNAVSLRLANAADAQAARAALQQLPGVKGVEGDGDSGRLTVFPHSGQSVLGPVNDLLKGHNWRIDELHLESGRLDEVFREITSAPGTAA